MFRTSGISSLQPEGALAGHIYGSGRSIPQPGKANGNGAIEHLQFVTEHLARFGIARAVGHEIRRNVFIRQPVLLQVLEYCGFNLGVFAGYLAELVNWAVANAFPEIATSSSMTALAGYPSGSGDSHAPKCAQFIRTVRLPRFHTEDAINLSEGAWVCKVTHSLPIGFVGWNLTSNVLA